MIQKMIEEKIIENLFYLFKNTTSFDIKNNCLQIMDLIITLKNPSIFLFLKINAINLNQLFEQFQQQKYNFK